MHSLGNDFALISRSDFLNHLNKVTLWGDRHRGIGFDQLVVYEKATEASAVNVEFYNQDGSFSASCGNGTRALAYFWNHLYQTTHLTIQTKAGSIQSTIIDNLVLLLWDRPNHVIFNHTQEILSLCSLFEKVFYLDCGNPHLVIWVKDGANIDELRNEFGKTLESYYLFPNKINVSFAKIDFKDSLTINLSVFERGVGPTLACGTAALSVFESFLNLNPQYAESEINVQQNGGSIRSTLKGNLIEQKANATLVFEGIIY